MTLFGGQRTSPPRGAPRITPTRLSNRQYGPAPHIVVFSHATEKTKNKASDVKASEQEIQRLVSDDVTCCCSDCGRTFTTRTGLGVHRRRAHPNTFHEEKVNERDAGLTRARWSIEELERLARLELSVGCIRAINQSLQASFPHRSVESSKSARRQSKYRALLSLCRDPVNDEIESPEVADKASETCDINKNIRAWAADRLKEQPKAGRDILEVLSRGAVDKVQAFLESYLKCPDAHQRYLGKVSLIPFREGKRVRGYAASMESR